MQTNSTALLWWNDTIPVIKKATKLKDAYSLEENLWQT